MSSFLSVLVTGAVVGASLSYIKLADGLFKNCRNTKHYNCPKRMAAGTYHVLKKIILYFSSVALVRSLVCSNIEGN